MPIPWWCRVLRICAGHSWLPLQLLDSWSQRVCWFKIGARVLWWWTLCRSNASGNVVMHVVHVYICLSDITFSLHRPETTLCAPLCCTENVKALSKSFSRISICSEYLPGAQQFMNFQSQTSIALEPSSAMFVTLAASTPWLAVMGVAALLAKEHHYLCAHFDTTGHCSGMPLGIRHWSYSVARHLGPVLRLDISAHIAALRYR